MVIGTRMIEFVIRGLVSRLLEVLVEKRHDFVEGLRVLLLFL